jgi:hypothetical protein
VERVRAAIEAEKKLTHVIQALLCWPKASCHAGSRDWKNSSGWKKVRNVNAFTMRKAISSATRPGLVAPPESLGWVAIDGAANKKHEGGPGADGKSQDQNSSAGQRDAEE